MGLQVIIMNVEDKQRINKIIEDKQINIDETFDFWITASYIFQFMPGCHACGKSNGAWVESIESYLRNEYVRRDEYQIHPK